MAPRGYALVIWLFFLLLPAEGKSPGLIKVSDKIDSELEANGLQALEQLRELDLEDALAVIRQLKSRHRPQFKPEDAPIYERLIEIRLSLPGAQDWYAEAITREVAKRTWGRESAVRYMREIATFDNRRSLEVLMGHLDHPRIEVELPLNSDVPPPVWLSGAATQAVYDIMKVQGLPSREGLREVELVAQVREWWEQNKDRPDGFFWPTPGGGTESAMVEPSFPQEVLDGSAARPRPEPEQASRKTGRGVVWLAVIIALLALLIVFAIRRRGQHPG